MFRKTNAFVQWGILIYAGPAFWFEALAEYNLPERPAGVGIHLALRVAQRGDGDNLKFRRDVQEGTDFVLLKSADPAGAQPKFRCLQHHKG